MRFQWGNLIWLVSAVRRAWNAKKLETRSFAGLSYSPLSSFFHHLRKRPPLPELFRMPGISYTSGMVLGAFLESVMYGEYLPLPRSPFSLRFLYQWLVGRHIRCSLYGCLLCPMGEIFERARPQPAYGLCYSVLWVRRHYRKRPSQDLTWEFTR